MTASPPGTDVGSGGPRTWAAVVLFAGAVLLGVGAATVVSAVGTLLVLAGAGCLVVAWLLRSRVPEPGARARRWRQVCTLLSMAATSIGALAVTLFGNADPDQGVLALPVGLGGTAVALLVARVLTGRRLVRARREAVQPEADRHDRLAGREHAERLRSELAEVDGRRGEYRHGGPLREEPDGTLLLPPDSTATRLRQAGAVAAVLPAAIVLGGRPLAFLLVVFGWQRGLLVFAGIAAGCGLLALICCVGLARREITRLTPAALETRTWYGRRRRLARSSIERALLVPVRLGLDRQDPVDVLMLIGSGGRCLRHVACVGPSREAWLALAIALGAPLEVEDRIVTPEEARRRFPGSLSWLSQHPHLAPALLAILIPAATVGSVVAWAVLTGNLD